MIISLAFFCLHALAAARQHGVGVLVRAELRRAQPLHNAQHDGGQSRPARNRAIAIWRRDPISGRLECRWMFDASADAAAS
jgi:hypothetical protein